MAYDPKIVEAKWQHIWEEKGYQVDLKTAQNPYYNLMMFPYPSAEGLHVGNVYAFTGSDIHGRFMRMHGYDVFEPVGFDAFGIHSENFAIKKGVHPEILIKKNVDNFRQQLKNLGCIFDWSHEVNTTEPSYYKWTQWLFLQLFKAGLCYKKKAPVDWCPSCKTVLADEQVIDGKCERCDSEVIQKETEQWFFKITKYAEKLLKNLNWVDWTESTKAIQKNWIGISDGTLVDFKVENSDLIIPIFTTRADTLFSASFIVLSPEHESITKLGDKVENLAEVHKYIETSKKKSEKERLSEDREKTGVELKGVKVINPVNGEKIVVWIADFVIGYYGTGAVFANAHDERDFAFAKKYRIPLKISLKQPDGQNDSKIKNFEECFTGDGILCNSSVFDGMTSEQARKGITDWLAKKSLGKKMTTCHLRDWLISRQRYWGPPIPIIYCKKCGTIPVPEEDLPVLLPYVENFRPEGTGQSPLASVENFVNTKCPKCNGEAKRETDVSDTFLDSSWYFFRYPSANLMSDPFDKMLTQKWLPVDMYIGGQEHAVLHLLYTRFITMVLKDLNYIDFEEPFKKFRAHGLLTKDGAKMSKSKGNVVNPDDYYKEYGADTLRMYLMFLGPFSEGGKWQDRGIVGVKRFLEKVWMLRERVGKEVENTKIDIAINKTIKKITQDLENLQYNTAISALMILVNEISKEGKLSADNYQSLLKLLAPFAPYITEELWLLVGNKDSVHNQKWPEYNDKLTKEEVVNLIIQVNGKVRDKIKAEAGISEYKARELAISSKNVQNCISGKEIKKIIFIPGKIINIVI